VDDGTVTGPSTEPTVPLRRRLLRGGVQLAVGLVQSAIVAVVFIAGLFLGYLVSLPLPAQWVDITVPWAGIILAATLGPYVVLHDGLWLHRLRLSRLRRYGTSAAARVEDFGIVGLSRQALITVFVTWFDPPGTQHRDRVFVFRGEIPAGFLEAVTGETVLVRYPAGRPRRFIIDIPYVPMTADAFI
jgi:hypothetical protein